VRLTVTVLLLAITVGVVAATAGADSSERDRLAVALDEAVLRYEVEAANRVLAEVRQLYGRDDSVATADLHVRASLAVAELLRMSYEETPPEDRVAKRTLGQRIDATVEEALRILEPLSESSERQRRRADLIATLIRSDFRAQKHKDAFDLAVARALVLDGRNARAWVAKAKPFLFAEPEHGGDVDEAVRLLSHALELDPILETALLLRAEAYEKLGDREAAAADRRAALARNPYCEPARARLGSGAHD
jgi:tetratricopeptide (TPR) repeat protein